MVACGESEDSPDSDGFKSRILLLYRPSCPVRCGCMNGNFKAAASAAGPGHSDFILTREILPSAPVSQKRPLGRGTRSARIH